MFKNILLNAPFELASMELFFAYIWYAVLQAIPFTYIGLAPHKFTPVPDVRCGILEKTCMYDVTTEDLQNEKATRYRVLSNGGPISYGEALDLLRNDGDFRSYLTEQLNKSAYTAFRWETPQIQTKTRSRDFEFVLLDNPSFIKRKTDSETYKSYFAATHDENGIVSFANLSGDATLIVPSPRTSEDAYGHFASFLRNAPLSQTDALWQKIGEVVLRMVSDRPLWLSTAGGGVAWLHVRLDSTPKYYGYAPYRNAG
jgi:hypothetical protein